MGRVKLTMGVFLELLSSILYVVVPGPWVWTVKLTIQKTESKHFALQLTCEHEHT